MIWIFTFKKRIDLNVQAKRILILYILNTYFQDYFRGENGPEVFCNLEEQINNFMDTDKEAKTAYQVYEKDEGAALIFVIITSLMIRVHQKIYVLVDNTHFFIFFFLCRFHTIIFLILQFLYFTPLQFLYFLNTLHSLHLKLNWLVIIINSLLR